MPKNKKARHLTYEERCQIEALLKIGFSNQQIANQLNRHSSTIGRELKRNTGQCGYRPLQATNSAIARRHAASSTPKKMVLATINIVMKMLHETQSSPEQIAGKLAMRHDIVVSHESIYRFIWKDKKAGGDLYQNLRRKAKRYNKRTHKNAGRGLIPGRIDIDQRPKIVEQKIRIGDIEVDTIVGSAHRGGIVSIVDRASKYTWLRLVPRITAKNVTKAINSALWGHKNRIYTITSDNGKEFARHASISKKLDAQFFFAKPYHAWERGLNEHTNGLVRQYFPKKTNFTTISQRDVYRVEKILNQRPRKSLNFSTPTEVFFSGMLQPNFIAFES